MLFNVIDLVLMSTSYEMLIGITFFKCNIFYVLKNTLLSDTNTSLHEHKTQAQNTLCIIVAIDFHW